jgi:peptidoglycan/LPS O-acetylase OafA/YrhL
LKKIQNIQALRGVAVMLVVVLHLWTVENKYGGLQTILPDILQFGMFGVDLFFVISGFVMVTVTRGKFRNSKNALTFLYHRFARIYPTYWFYSLAVLVVFLIHPSWVNSNSGNQVDIIRSFLLLPAQTIPLVMVGWTLIHELYFYLVFFFILLFIPEQKMPVALFSWGLVIVVVHSLYPANSPTLKVIFNPLTLEFIGGCFLAILYHKYPLTARAGILLALSLAVAALSLYAYYFYHGITGEVEPLQWWRILIWGVPALLIIYFLINAERNGYVAGAYLILIGNASYSIYLSHILTLNVVGRVWSIFSVDSIGDNLVMLPLLFVLVISVGIGSYFFIERPLARMCRKIA